MYKYRKSVGSGRKVSGQRESIKNFLAQSTGWKVDRYGNLVNEEKNRRYKFNDTSLRFEVKSGKDWIRVRSGYYKNLTVEDGKLHGMAR